MKTLLYLISWSYKTIFPYSNIFGWCPHILTQINVFLNLSKYLMIEYEVALKTHLKALKELTVYSIKRLKVKNLETAEKHRGISLEHI